MIHTLRRLFSSKWFRYLLFTLFIVQGVWYSVGISFGIPADEIYHFRFIEYYASRPVSAGPIINQQSYDIFVLGDIERTVSYLYHYILSFPLKLLQFSGANVLQQIAALRVVNLVFSLLSLITIIKILKNVGQSYFIQNVVLLLMCLTGMYVWLGASINYDNFAMLLFFLLLYTALGLIKKITLQQLLVFLALSIALVLTKLAFAPIGLSVWLVVGGLVAKKLYKEKGSFISQFSDEAQKKKRQLSYIIPIVIILLFLGIERVGGNLYRYQGIAPSCSEVHEYQDCLRSDIFVRSENQKKIAKELRNTNEFPQLNIIQYTADWLDKMYERTFFYFGHKEISASNGSRVFFFVSGIFISTLVLLKNRKLIRGPKLQFLVFVTLLYLLTIYLVNLYTFTNIGVKFGFQGRYLLPVIPFVYLFILMVLNNAIKSKRIYTSRVIVAVSLVFLMLHIHFHSPPLVFTRGADDSWRSSVIDNTN